MSFVHDLLASLLENASDASMTAKLVLPYEGSRACSARRVRGRGFAVYVRICEGPQAYCEVFQGRSVQGKRAWTRTAPFAHLAIIKLLDVVDDTKLLVKHIVSLFSRDSRRLASIRTRERCCSTSCLPNSKYFAPSDVLLIERRFVVVDGEQKSTSKKDA